MLNQQNTNVVYAYIDDGPSGGLYEVYVNTNEFDGTEPKPPVTPAFKQAFNGTIITTYTPIHYIEGVPAIRRM